MIKLEKAIYTLSHPALGMGECYDRLQAARRRALSPEFDATRPHIYADRTIVFTWGKAPLFTLPFRYKVRI